MTTYSVAAINAMSTADLYKLAKQDGLQMGSASTVKQELVEYYASQNGDKTNSLSALKTRYEASKTSLASAKNVFIQAKER